MIFIQDKSLNTAENVNDKFINKRTTSKLIVYNSIIYSNPYNI